MSKAETLKQAVAAACDWLEENRDNHITGALAKTASGKTCRPNSPEASCYCVLGRISHELNLDDYPIDDPEYGAQFRATLLASGLGPDRGGDDYPIFNMNDAFWSDENPRVCGGRARRGNPAVLDFVRGVFGVEKKA